jgi:hypothetical protein
MKEQAADMSKQFKETIKEEVSFIFFPKAVK